jgi:hypothetical protein
VIFWLRRRLHDARRHADVGPEPAAHGPALTARSRASCWAPGARR